LQAYNTYRRRWLLNTLNSVFLLSRASGDMIELIDWGFALWVSDTLELLNDRICIR